MKVSRKGAVQVWAVTRWEGVGVHRVVTERQSAVRDGDVVHGWQQKGTKTTSLFAFYEKKNLKRQRRFFSHQPWIIQIQMLSRKSEKITEQVCRSAGNAPTSHLLLRVLTDDSDPLRWIQINWKKKVWFFSVYFWSGRLSSSELFIATFVFPEQKSSQLSQVPPPLSQSEDHRVSLGCAGPGAGCALRRLCQDWGGAPGDLDKKQNRAVSEIWAAKPSDFFSFNFFSIKSVFLFI